MRSLKRLWEFITGHKLLFTTLLVIGLLLQLSRLHYRNKFLSAKVVTTEQKIKQWTDVYGRGHTQLQERTVYLTQLGVQDRATIDSQAHLLSIKPKYITKYVEVSSQTKGSFEATTDTSGHFAFGDGHLRLEGSIGNLGSGNGLRGNYLYTDKARIVFHKDPIKVLGIPMGIFGNHDYIDVAYDNPNTVITGLKNVSLKKFAPPRHWGIGPQAGVLYDGHVRPYIGFGISYNLIRL